MRWYFKEIGGINDERILEQIVDLIGEKEKTFTEMVKAVEKSEELLAAESLGGISFEYG